MERLLFTQAIQPLLPTTCSRRDAVIDPPAADGGGGENFVAEVALGDFLVAVGTRLEDEACSGFVAGVEVVADQHERGAKEAPQPLLPHLFPRVAFPAGSDANPVLNAVKVAVLY